MVVADSFSDAKSQQKAGRGQSCEETIPDSFGSHIERECAQIAGGKANNNIGESGNQHRRLHIGKSAQNAEADYLQSVEQFK
jgi:hypothetical protein